MEYEQEKYNVTSKTYVKCKDGRDIGHSGASMDHRIPKNEINLTWDQLDKCCYMGKTAETKGKSSLLFDIIKTCTYRYTSKNPRDPCKDVMPNKIELQGTTYDGDALEALGFCPRDILKLNTMVRFLAVLHS
jgi:hypothetical protein